MNDYQEDVNTAIDLELYALKNTWDDFIYSDYDEEPVDEEFMDINKKQ